MFMFCISEFLADQSEAKVFKHLSGSPLGRLQVRRPAMICMTFYSGELFKIWFWEAFHLRMYRHMLVLSISIAPAQKCSELLTPFIQRRCAICSDIHESIKVCSWVSIHVSGDFQFAGTRCDPARAVCHTSGCRRCSS